MNLKPVIYVGAAAVGASAGITVGRTELKPKDPNLGMPVNHWFAATGLAALGVVQLVVGSKAPAGAVRTFCTAAGAALLSAGVGLAGGHTYELLKGTVRTADFGPKLGYV